MTKIDIIFDYFMLIYFKREEALIMNLRTKRMLCLLIAIASVMTIVGSVSYAYFTAMGEVTPMDATLNTAYVSVKFSDNDLGLNAELNFGNSVTKKFTIENTGTADAKIKMFFDKMTNTYTEGSLTYTLSYSETEDGPYTEVVSKTNVPQSQKFSEKILANSLTIPLSKTYYYELKITLNYLNDVNQDEDINAIFNTKFKVEDINYEINLGLETLKHLKQTSQGVRTNFDETATTDEGIFEMEDDYGTSYYYRGAVENNYVKFAGFYWRIIRINGDGSLRIIYDGTQAHVNGANSSNRFITTNTKYNINYNDVKYVGWMYGPRGNDSSTSKEEAQTNTADSTIKGVVDSWYKTNIEDAGYGSEVSDTLFCNDRSTPGKEVTGWKDDTRLGFGSQNTAYGATSRTNMWNSVTSVPTFKCSQKNDAFTVNDTIKGNGALTYPVGLITADEIVAAGSGKYGIANTSYYLYRGSSYYYWSLSPYYFYDTHSYIFIVYKNGDLNSYGVNNDGAVVPVINLSVEYVSGLTGDGTIENPYQEEIL